MKIIRDFFKKKRDDQFNAYLDQIVDKFNNSKNDENKTTDEYDAKKEHKVSNEVKENAKYYFNNDYKEDWEQRNKKAQSSSWNKIKYPLLMIALPVLIPISPVIGLYYLAKYLNARINNPKVKNNAIANDIKVEQKQELVKQQEIQPKEKKNDNGESVKFVTKQKAPSVKNKTGCFSFANCLGFLGCFGCCNRKIYPVPTEENKIVVNPK